MVKVVGAARGQDRGSGRVLRYYTATALRRAALAESRAALAELAGELLPVSEPTSATVTKTMTGIQLPQSTLVPSGHGRDQLLIRHHHQVRNTHAIDRFTSEQDDGARSRADAVSILADG